MRYRELAYKAGIYLITNQVSRKVYIGSACDLSERRRRHFGHLRTNRHFNAHLQSAWNKYGEESFTFSILLVCDKANLLLFEQRALDFFRCSRGVKMLYNLNVLATNGLGRKLTPEHRAKLSVISKERNPFLGKNHTPENRARMSAAAQERCATPEWKAQQSLRSTGRKDTPETTEKRRASALARAPMSEVSKEKIRASKVGVPRPSAIAGRRAITPTCEIVLRTLALRAEGKSQQQIAELLNISRSKVWDYLHVRPVENLKTKRKSRNAK